MRCEIIGHLHKGHAMNTAGRLLSIYTRLVATHRDPNLSMVKVWAEVFELPHTSPHLEDDVVVCLQAMRGEMEFLRMKLGELEAPEELMHPGITRLRNISSTAHINAAWNGLRDEASKPENRLSFAWASWVLRDESEDEMTHDELAALRTELDSLEASVKSAEMTSYMRGFIQRQIDAIRAALQLYPIRGVKPIEEAVRTVVGTCDLEARVLAKEFEKASADTRSVFARTGQFIEKTAKLADNLDKIRKTGEGAYTLATSVGPVLLTFVQNLSK